MKITPLNYFEPVDDNTSYQPYEKGIDMTKFKEAPDFIVVENEFHEDEVFVCNEHWFMNPKDPLNRTTYSESTKLVGVWNVNYKSA